MQERKDVTGTALQPPPLRIGLIGGGFMGSAIVEALVRNHVVEPGNLIVSDILAHRREQLASNYGVLVTENNANAAMRSDICILAVKPQDFPSAAVGLKGCLAPHQTIVSIMAGVKIEQLAHALGHRAVVRVMPNTPAYVGAGFGVWTATPEVPEESRERVRRILQAMGREVYVEDEKYIDMATAVSGSGPGFVFLLIEAMIDAAVHIGLPRQVAEPMVVQTFLGSAQLATHMGKHPAELRNMVTSPGGTTTEGLLALEKAGVRAALVEAVVAAYEKTQALGG